MEQLEPSGPPADRPAVAPRRQPRSTTETPRSPPRRATGDDDNDRPTLAASLPATAAASYSTDSADSTSHSVPSLRFPRPLGNRELTNWVSSSSPDIMRNYGPLDEAPLDASIDDLSYEFIGTDGESQSESATNSDDHHIPELVDDVQSIADMTDTTGTDAETNEVETDSSDDDGEGDWQDHTGTARASIITESHAVDMESMADRSLEHPTEIFPRASLSSDHLGQSHGDAAQGQDAAQLLAGTGADKERGELPSPTKTEQKEMSTLKLWIEPYLDHAWNERANLKRLLLILLTTLVSVPIVQYMYPHGQSCELSTVPVASVSSLGPNALTETLVSTSTVTSTLTSTTTFNALQTTSSEKSLGFMPFGKEKAPATETEPIVIFCSAEVHGRNEILLKVPQQIKSAWLARQAIMISLSRGNQDISPGSTKVSSVDQGFVIEVPLREAHGILDVAIATTKKPKINETFQVNFGNHAIGDALDTGKQFMKAFAQTVVDTVDDTTAWVEDACLMAFEAVSRQVPAHAPTASDLMQRAKEVAAARARMMEKARQALARESASDRLHQAESELVRQALDAGDGVRLKFLQAQLSSRLWWLKVRGKDEERQRYLAAAESYYREKSEAAARASRSRAEAIKKDIRARRSLERRHPRRLFWQGGEDGR